MINIPKGLKDVLPNESYKWEKVMKVVYDLAKLYNIKEIRTPIFEHTELFLRGVGDSTDIVNKEMYTFLDKGGRSITLRPEGTAGVVRSFIENSLFNEALPLKMFYVLPNFRYEKPQAGRYRQHTQFGVEVYGADTPESDAETIMIGYEFYKKFGIKPQVHINNLGCSICKNNYVEALKTYFEPKLSQMCEDCKRRYKTNPLRLLDCKEENCKLHVENAPKMADYLCEDCKTRFVKLQEILTALNIDYIINPILVRGLDYYSNTVFEFYDADKTKGLNALGGGGRYNNLVEELGGKATPVVGFGIGIERLLLYLESKNINIENENKVEVYVANITNDTIKIMEIVKNLRDNGISCEMNLSGRSLKAQFKYADKINAKFVITVGEDELTSGMFNIKDMFKGTQGSIPENKIVEYILENRN